MWLTRLALRNPILILMISLLVVVLGGLSLSRLGVDLFPNVDTPVLCVATAYEGASPEDIEKSITVKIERAVASAPGAERVESVSKQGVSLVTVYFAHGRNLDAAQFEVSQRIGQVQSQLPPGIRAPIIYKFDVSNYSTLKIVLEGEGLDDRELYDAAFNMVSPQLESIPGVASASVFGGQQRQIDVRVDREQLRARELGILDVVDAVKRSNLLLPSGNIGVGDQRFNIFTNTQVDTVRELGNVVVHRGGRGSSAISAREVAPTIRVSDVAKVVDGVVDESHILRVNGKRGVLIRVVKQPGANTVQVADAVREQLKNIHGVPPNLRMRVSFDQSAFIRSAIRSLEHEALQGGLLAIVVTLVFLVSVRATAVVSISIPLSILATFIVLYLAGATLNVVTLGGLALGIGRRVDDSIVELENIHRHFGFTPDRKRAVLDAAQEVAMPILVSTVTTIIVFFPVVLLTGVAKNLFLPLAMTMSFSLGVSFFVSRTVTPLLCLRWIKAGHSKTALARSITKVLDAIDASYEAALRKALHHRRAVVGGTVAACLASLALITVIGTEFFPPSDEGQIEMTYRGPVGTRVERADEAGRKIEEVIRQEAGEGSRVITVAECGLPPGRAAIFSDNSGLHACELDVILGPAEDRAQTDAETAERIKKAIGAKLGGGTVTARSYGMVSSVFNFGAKASIDVQILGQDLEASAEYAKHLAERMRSVRTAKGLPVLTDVWIAREENAPEFDVVVDRHKAGALGLTEEQVAQTVLASVVGSAPFSPIPFIDPKNGREYPINVRLADPYRSHAADLHEIILKPPTGAPVPLVNVARIERNSKPVQIERKHRQRVVDVTANVAPETDLGTASAAVNKLLRELPPPDGLRAHLDGVALKQGEAFRGLGLAAAIALLLVYMVLASQFRSFLDPLVIMFSVPLGVSGVLVALAATRTTLNVNSGMGIIMMVGIVVSNGVMLVDFANVLRRRGVPLRNATIHAARTRLRPILMTSIATVGALLPMALGLHKGDTANLPLARAVIGGLTVSTFFTLFLIPSLYTLVDRVKHPPNSTTTSEARAEDDSTVERRSEDA